MTIFLGLEEILKCVIENTNYISATGEDQEMPNEQRYHNVMKALFGDFHPDEYLKPPKGFTFSDILWACRQKAAGKSFEGAVKQLCAGKLKKPIKPKTANEKEMDEYYAAMVEYEDQFEDYKECAVAHCKRHRKFYEKRGFSTKSNHTPTLPEEDSDEIEEQKKDILVALHKAGWPL